MRLPRVRFAVRRMMVPVVAVVIGIALWCGSAVHWFLIGTVYSAGYSEPGFHTIRIGMTPDQVERVMGQPLGKAPWGDRTENWQYSAGGGPMFFHRRWVIFTDSKVSTIVSDVFDE
jgi:hypothetical protein